MRTPLNAIIGFAGTILMKLPGPLTPDQEGQLNTVADSARHLLSLVEDLLDLASIESGKVAVALEEVSCREVVEKVAELLRREAENKGLEFELVQPVVDLRVRADRRIVSRILLTLARDAVKFTESGHVRLGIQLADDSVGIIVADTSRNVPTDRQAFSLGFEHVNANSPTPYDARRRGLYLSQKLAALTGARLSFASEPGGGAAFTLTIPAVDFSEKNPPRKRFSR